MGQASIGVCKSFLFYELAREILVHLSRDSTEVPQIHCIKVSYSLIEILFLLNLRPRCFVPAVFRTPPHWETFDEGIYFPLL